MGLVCCEQRWRLSELDVVDGNMKKDSGFHSVEEGTRQSVLQTRIESSSCHDSVCTVGLRKEGALGIEPAFATGNHQHPHDLDLCFHISFSFS